MFEEFIAVIHSIGVTLAKILPVTIALGATFTVLSFFWACNPGQPWWRKRELVTDLCYWFVIPLFARYLRIGLLVIGAALLFGITTAEGLVEFYDDGHGPLARLPLWLQAVIFLVGSDFMMYWLHRAFHRSVLWKYHAVHHSSADLDWISAARFHPINIFLGSVATDVVLLLAGISPNVLVFLGPFTVAHSAFVHANLNWTLGPFKYVLAGPVFHRWHHTMAERGGEKNFASTFPVLDLMFGTFYMPKNEVPDAYGIADASFPPTFGRQLLYPFRRWRRRNLRSICTSFTNFASTRRRRPAHSAAVPSCRPMRKVRESSMVLASEFGARAFDVIRGLAVAFILIAVVAPRSASADDIAVILDQAKLVKLPEKVATIVVGNPLIADATVQAGGLMIITGKGYGRTNIVALDRSGAVMMEKIVEVQEPRVNVVYVYRGVERASYSCTPYCDPRITLGDSPAYFDAVIAQTATRNGLAQGYAMQAR